VRRTLPPISLIVAASIGGIIGALARWSLAVAFPDATGFPWTTLTINVSGSFLLALLPAAAWVRRQPVLPVFLGTGVLGGYTTLSTYAEQGRALLAAGEQLEAFAYLAGTLLACVAAARLAHHWSTSAAQLEFEAEEGNE
jgi:CrcB protein